MQHQDTSDKAKLSEWQLLPPLPHLSRLQWRFQRCRLKVEKMIQKFVLVCGTTQISYMYMYITIFPLFWGTPFWQKHIPETLIWAEAKDTCAQTATSRDLSEVSGSCTLVRWFCVLEHFSKIKQRKLDVWTRHRPVFAWLWRQMVFRQKIQLQKIAPRITAGPSWNAQKR